MAQKFKEGGNKLEAIHIVNSSAGHLWAVMQIRENNDLHESGSGLSIPLALAIHLNTPIFIETDLLNELSSSEPTTMNQSVKLIEPFEFNKKD